MLMDVSGKEEYVDGLVLAGLFWGRIARGTVAGAPVLRKDV